jgi:hypothetical protein
MRTIIPTTVLTLVVAFSSPALGAVIDWAKVDTALGKTARPSKAKFIATAFPAATCKRPSMASSSNQRWRLEDGSRSSPRRMAQW